jgi:hypothetical protein
LDKGTAWDLGESINSGRVVIRVDFASELTGSQREQVSGIVQDEMGADLARWTPIEGLMGRELVRG